MIGCHGMTTFILVKKIAADFLAGVQKNPRIRILANPFPNFKMIWSPTYSRTTRLGELYEKYFYAKEEEIEENRDLHINDYRVDPPENSPGTFVPKKHNWMRESKIPELILNATTLNSGHNWQFTVTWMGESPVQVSQEVDKNTRYRRLHYSSDAPPKNTDRSDWAKQWALLPVCRVCLNRSPWMGSTRIR